MKVFKTMKRGAVIVLTAMGLCGCAHVPDDAGQNVADPWESVNRQTFAFNAVVDELAIRPVAKGYQTAVPTFVQDRVGNFFANMTEPRNILNNLLQGKGHDTMVSLYRFVVNSTLGVGGLFDVADSWAGQKSRAEDFGQTLRVWGVPTGPYVVLPFLGPSTISDATGIVVGWYTEPLAYADDDLVKWGSTALYMVDQRARIMPATDLLRDAVDPYVMAREGFLATRRNNAYDGNPPLELIQDEFEDQK